MSWSDWAAAQLAAERAKDRERAVVDFDARGPLGMLHGRQVVSFASNDYLGLTTHPSVVAAAIEAAERWGTGTAAARLTVGARPIHRELENEIASWKATEAALLFSSGYAANVGTLAVLGARAPVIFSDELNHASIIDGCRMARREVVVYPHLDLDYLERALASASGPAIVATDAVFSMDGDVAPIDALADLCARHDALLVVDEAHAVFPLPQPDPAAEVLVIGTMSKFLGSFGGFVAGSREIIALLTNRARSFIFSTALSPSDTAAALAALRVVRSSEGDALKERLRRLIARVRPRHPSPIVPLIVGNESAALEASRRLLARGLFVPAIRPPSVPEGTARLRIALSAAHSDEQVAALVDALERLELVGA